MKKHLLALAIPLLTLQAASNSSCSSTETVQAIPVEVANVQAIPVEVAAFQAVPVPLSQDWEQKSCSMQKIASELEKCFPEKQACPTCKDPVCPEPKCPEIPPFPECPKPKDESKCEQAAQKCAEKAEKCEERQEGVEKKCEASKQVCEDAQIETEKVEAELEAVAEELGKMENELEKTKSENLELKKHLNQEKQARSDAEKKVLELEKILKQKEGEEKNPPDPEVEPGNAITDLLNEINKEREAAKVGKLYISSRLVCAAERHSEDMGKTKVCSHTGSDKSSPWDRASKCGTKAYGEIIACGQKTPRDAVEGWLKSPPHKKIMLDGKFKSVGLAMSGNYWTAIFGY